MRRLSLTPAVSSFFAPVIAAGAVALVAATASAAQPAAPAPATATTTEVSTPSDNAVVVVSTTTTPAAPTVAPAPAPAPTAVAAPTVAPPPPAPQVDRLEEARRLKRAEKGRAIGLAAGGWATLGSTYFASALIGTIMIDTSESAQGRRYGSWMTLPVAGPFAAAFNARSATGTLFTTTLGVAQAAGFTMALIGHVRHRRAKRDLQLMAMPTRGGGHVGLSMRF